MDTELLAEIASAHGNHADQAAKVAFGKFYQRHAAWLYNRLCRTNSVGLLRPSDSVHDVVQETFYRAFKGAKTFNPNYVSDPRRLEALVRGWLGGIANRVIADMLRNSEHSTAESSQLESWHSAWAETDQSMPDSPVVKALQSELKKLSPLQQDIIAAAELYYQPNSNYQRLPNGVAKMLAEKHSTSSANIRQVRRRTMALLRKKLEYLLEES